jgi:hypothetical protein
MALDPNIALGVKSLELPNPLVQYGQLAQIQNAQNQNQLAQYQLGSAQREQESVNALNQAYAKAYDQKTGQINADVLRQSLASGGFGSKLPAVEKGLLELGKLKTETQKADVDLVDAKLKQARSFLDTINPLDPRAPEQYIAWHQSNHADPVLGPVLKARGSTPEQSMARIQQAIQAGPQAFADLLNASKLGTEKFIELNKPVTFAQDTGGGGRLMSRAGLGGPATLVPGSDYTKSQTFADITAAKQATTSAGQLSLARQKFAWEQANPGYELKEAEDGSIVGVNKRTLQAFPVSIGGAAPAAAPMAQTGVPGARMPAATTVPAIPGMTSVLDQQAPAAAPAGGMPLMGKGTAMTETQSNAAMFGGAMAQAQNTIKQLEKSGTVKNAVVPGLLTGLAQMVPFGVGEGIGNVIQSTFNADPTGLIGPNAAQQKLAQSQLAFATAYLRKTSGAAFGASEISNTIKEFFPLVGEGEKVIAQKAAARERAVEGMKISTTKEGRKYIEGYGGGGAPAAAGGGGIPNATPTNPLGLNVPGVR